ncbi:vitamin K epoxide reductase complex subunit 1 [Microplitis demolitor]|uniref:vitamin K epoxide reductase complex subunit 1 n=1 Tax=Microplitis demolitor TaxID=69319 RepID=UPI0004CD0218|nr:vitamin K epoxide reductase complex subunit 1 [Microplitis demolitor]
MMTSGNVASRQFSSASTINKKLDKINAGIITSCIVGMSLSYYAYIVETTKEKDHNYMAMCDISEHVSCTRAFMSEYGKGFGLIPKTSIFYLPNSVYGLVFYGIVFALNIFNNYGLAVIVLILTALSNLSSIYLAWVLWVLNDICVVCISTYIVNFILVILSYNKLLHIRRQISATAGRQTSSSGHKTTHKKKRH